MDRIWMCRTASSDTAMSPRSASRVPLSSSRSRTSCHGHAPSVSSRFCSLSDEHGCERVTKGEFSCRAVGSRYQFSFLVQTGLEGQQSHTPPCLVSLHVKGGSLDEKIVRGVADQVPEDCLFFLGSREGVRKKNGLFAAIIVDVQFLLDRAPIRWRYNQRKSRRVSR